MQHQNPTPNSYYKYTFVVSQYYDDSLCTTFHDMFLRL